MSQTQRKRSNSVLFKYVIVCRSKIGAGVQHFRQYTVVTARILKEEHLCMFILKEGSVTVCRGVLQEHHAELIS